MKSDNFTKLSPGRILWMPEGFSAFVPVPLPPNIVWNSNLVTALSAADRAVGELAGLLKALEKEGILRRTGERKRNQLYVAVEVLAAIEKPLPGDSSFTR